MAAIIASVLGLEGAKALGNTWATGVLDSLFDDDAVPTRPSVLAFALLVNGAVFWFAAVVGSWINGRSVRSLIEPLRPFKWSIVRKVLALQAGLTLLMTAPSFLLPAFDSPEFTGFGLSHLIWLIPLVLMTLIQTSGEDVYFKGFLLRQLGAATKVFWFAPIAVVAVFVSLHVGNPDLQDNLWLLLPIFVASELTAIYLTMRTGGMEVAICWHWFNNITIVLFVAERATQANELTLFVFDEDPDTIADEIIGAGIYVAFLVVQLLALTSRRSPFFLEPHGWKPRPLAKMSLSYEASGAGG